MPLRSRCSALFAFVLLLGAVACGQQTAAPTCTGQTVRLINDDILTFGTDLAYPPFAFDDPESKEPAGFEVDLANAIATQLGVKLLLVNRTSAALIPGVLAHRHDVAASAQLDTPELHRELCVSAPYLDADLGLLARRGEIPSVAGTDDLDGRLIGVTKGTRGERWAVDHAAAGMQIRRFETTDDAVTALAERQIDGALDDLPVLAYIDKRVPDVVVVDEVATGDEYVLALAPDNRGLTDAVNDAIGRLRSNGKLETLRIRWFGE